jgi:hypothetical protein
MTFQMRRLELSIVVALALMALILGAVMLRELVIHAHAASAAHSLVDSCISSTVHC